MMMKIINDDDDDDDDDDDEVATPKSTATHDAKNWTWKCLYPREDEETSLLYRNNFQNAKGWTTTLVKTLGTLTQ